MAYELTRAARAIALAGDVRSARGLAIGNYGIGAPSADWLRRAQDVLDTQGSITDANGEPVPFARGGDFVALVDRRSIISRMSDAVGGGFRAVVPYRPLLLQTDGAVAHWTAEAKIKITSADAAFRADYIPVRKITGMTIATQEFMRKIDEASDAILQRDLSRAVADRLSATFAGNTAPDDDQPGGIFHHIEPLASTGSLEGDIALLIDNFPGDLGTSCLVTTPAIAARFNLAGHDQVGAQGGYVAGIATATSDAVADGVLGIVDLARVLMYDGPVVPATSQQGIVTVEDEQGEASVLSLWQANLAAVRVEKFCYWRLADPRCARWISDAGAGTGDVRKAKQSRAGA
ncbi:phage major capsid protein [Paraburkholderia sp. BR10923]|uniref:phage major capsid family protein n=1 Tax=Paraburkholderia sp. BR10923 TaxID=3236992 RepID=UPI0034CD9F3B